MTIVEFATLILLAIVTTIGTWRLMRRHRRRETEAGRDPRSGEFASAAASTLLAMKVDPLIRAGTTIYMPVGDGLYMSRTTSAKARAWQRTLADWLRRGAIINVIVTVPNEAARVAWQRMEKEFPDRFHYYELDRKRAPADLASEIGKLDTYHPILVVNSNGEFAPGAMWIEQYHPLDSSHAYAVQYVAPAETKTDDRFGRFLALYHRLLEGGHAHAGITPLKRVA